MRVTRAARLALAAALLAASACGGDEAAPAAGAPRSPEEAVREATEAVDDERLRAADADRANWLSHGRTYSEQRFSPLEQVNAGNVARLVRTWSFDTGLTRGHEATPIAVDGTLFLTGSWSVVFALDARTGRLLWSYDPKVSKADGAKACCDVVNRGVAVHEGRVFFGALDGRLVALDAATGALLWEVVSVDQTKNYTITGAPRVVKGRVIVGNGGAEFGVRGYVSAYDPETGELAWRTYTVPGDPSQPFESEALEKAAASWTGEWWKVGGGGTVWDSMAFDPELDLLYVGTGNGSPWSKYARSPGGGDNLYLSSILALDPDTGEIVWHYQTTPGDNWDYTATQHMVLADLEIDGRTRKVLMQAPKNGFFYVLDRETGELVSAEKYVEVTWAERVDRETGRPVLSGSAEYRDDFAIVKPTVFGGHNWQPMSYSPKTGLVYIPAQEILGVYGLDPKFAVQAGPLFNTATDAAAFALLSPAVVSGHLLAWDPVAQKEVWRHPYAMPWNGGTLATAGNLVFQGTADGRFVAYRADDGRQLWESHAGTGIIAAPITYEVDGTQYVTVVAGWGGAFAMVGGPAAAQAGVESHGRVLTFALFDQPVTVDAVKQLLASRDPSQAPGEDLYHAYCARCHGALAVGSGVIADLRKSVRTLDAAFPQIIATGLPDRGMPGFASVLTPDEIAQVHAYVRRRAATGD